MTHIPIQFRVCATHAVVSQSEEISIAAKLAQFELLVGRRTRAHGVASLRLWAWIEQKFRSSRPRTEYRPPFKDH